MNRFNKPTQLASYKPLSFQELAFAPVTLRQREDTMNNQKDAIFHEMNNIVGFEGFDEETNAMKAQMEEKLNGLAGKIQKNGAGSMEYQNEFRNLRNEYNKLVSKTGALGMSSAIKENLDTQKAAFYKMALENGQTNTERIAQKWEEEVQKYTKGLPSSISKLNGQIPQFNPLLPPKSQDLPTHAAKLVSMMGNFKKEWGKVRFEETGTDPETGEPVYKVFDEKGYDITNEPQVESMMNILKRDVLDERSAINQDLRWKGYEPEEYLNTIKDIAAGVTSTAEGYDVNYKGDTDNSRGRSSSSSSSTTTKDPKDQADLMEVPNGMEYVPGSESIEALKKKQQELRDDDTMPDATKQQLLTATRHARRHKERQITEFKGSEEYNNIAEKVFDNNRELSIYGLKSYEDVQAALEDPSKMKFVISTGDGNHREPTLLERKHALNRLLEPLNEKIYTRANAAASKPIVANSQQFLLSGMGKADDDLRKGFVSIVTPDLVESMSMQGRLDISVGRGSDTRFTTVSPEDNPGLFENLMQDLTDGKAKLEFGALNSGDEMSNAELQYTIVDAEGLKYDFTIDLQNDDFSKNLLAQDQPLWQSLNPDDRKKVDAMRDNIKYAGLATTDAVYDDPIFWFKDEKSTNVRNHAISNYTDIGFMSVLQNPDVPSSKERFIHKSMFVDPEDQDAKYAMLINDDSSYSMTKKHKDGTVEYYSFEDYANKGIAEQYLKDNANPRYSKKYHDDFMDTPEAEQYKKERKYAMMVRMVNSLGDIRNPSKNATVYSNDPIFIQAMTEFKNVWNSNSPDNTKFTAAMSAYDKIKDLQLKARQKNSAF